MSEFNFKSQICTSKSQSEKLLALGLKKETADMCSVVDIVSDGKTSGKIETIFSFTPDDWDDFGREVTPRWSLHRLIEITKLKVTPFLYGVEISHPQWERAFVKKANVWDNLCDCIEWLIKEGHFNEEYLDIETIGLPKEIDESKGFDIDDNKELGNGYGYLDLPLRKR